VSVSRPGCPASAIQSRLINIPGPENINRELMGLSVDVYTDPIKFRLIIHKGNMNATKYFIVYYLLVGP